jgi:hypothetical protein
VTKAGATRSRDVRVAGRGGSHASLGALRASADVDVAPSVRPICQP